MDFITKQKSAFWLIVVLLLLNVTTLVLLLMPQDFKRPPMGKPGISSDKEFKSELNLTTKQKTQFEQYRKDYFDVLKNYTSQINNKKYELMEALFNNKPDTNKLNLLADELGVMNAEFEKARFGQILKFKTILTEEQFNVFKKIVDEAYKPKPGDMGRGGPPPHEFDAHIPDKMPPPFDEKHKPGNPPPPPSGN